MVKRKIIEIDEEKCNGCGECVPACEEGAIKIEDGVAKLKEERLCDGLGACLGECPQDAIEIIEREADEFDEKAVQQELAQSRKKTATGQITNGGCPGSRMRNFSPESKNSRPKTTSNPNQGLNAGNEDIQISINSQLDQWPVQLNLLPETAPFFSDADLLIAADCVPVAYPDFHLDMLKNKKVVIGCPKLDNLNNYLQKLKGIVEKNDLNSISVAIMEVPCCRGLAQAVKQAVRESEKDLEVNEIVISVKGEKK